jgi:hypothetical protein
MAEARKQLLVDNVLMLSHQLLKANERRTLTIMMRVKGGRRENGRIKPLHDLKKTGSEEIISKKGQKWRIRRGCPVIYELCGHFRQR